MTTYTYPNAIIYRIVCNETGEVYIGSTVGTLARRMTVHRHAATQYNKWGANGSVGKRPDGCRCCSIQILNRNTYTVFQIEPYPCNTLSELCLREGGIQIQYKKDIGTLCINRCIAGALTRAGGKVKYQKQRYTDNVETIREQHKQYYTDNAETICEQQKQYRQKNATKVAAQIAVKHTCSVCGGRYTHGNKAQHFKTKMHQGAMHSDSPPVAKHDS